MSEEHFTFEQLDAALKQFIHFGEDTFNPGKAAGDLLAGHAGYFSGAGFAARALRALRAKLPVLMRDAELGRRTAVVANAFGWNGVENSKLLDLFVEERLTAADDDRRALQQIMQVLGPTPVLPNVDYADPGNFAGLTYEVEEVMRILKSRGIEYQGRRHRDTH